MLSLLMHHAFAEGDAPQKRLVRPDGITIPYASPQQVAAKRYLVDCDYQPSASSAYDSSHCTAQNQQPQAPSPAGKPAKLKQRLSSCWGRATCRGCVCGPLPEEPQSYEEQDPSLIDGPQADIWAVGVLLYELVSCCDRS